MPRVTKSPAPKLTAARLRATKTTSSNGTKLTHDEIAKRAYHLFLQEGAVHGRDMDHWLLAEQELKPTVSAD